MNFSWDYFFMWILHVIYSTTIFVSNPINLFPVFEFILTNNKLSLYLKL